MKGRGSAPHDPRISLFREALKEDGAADSVTAEEERVHGRMR
jgi:hypothetical protein